MKNRKFSCFLFIILTTVLIFILAPLGLLTVRGVSRIREVFLREEIRRSLSLSFITSSISTLIVLFLGLPVAYLLARRKGSLYRLISFLIFLPMSLPHIVLGIGLLLFLGNSGIGSFLNKFNIDFVFTRSGIVMAQVFVNLPFMIKNLKTVIEDLSPRMEFVGRTLGANDFQTFYYITLPLIRRSLVSSTIISFSRALGEFGAVMMLAGAAEDKQVIPTSIFMSMSTGDLDLALSTAVVLIFISLITTSLFEYLNRGDEDA